MGQERPVYAPEYNRTAMPKPEHRVANALDEIAKRLGHIDNTLAKLLDHLQTKDQRM